MSGHPAQYQHQTWTRVVSRGPSPAAAMNQLQDWPGMTPRAGSKMCGVPTRTGRGLRGSCLRILIPAILLPAGGRVHRFDFLILPVEQSIRPFHRMQRRGSRPVAAHTLPNQQSFQAIADLGHSCGRLSCMPSSDGSKTIGKALTDAQIFFASGANAHE